MKVRNSLFSSIMGLSILSLTVFIISCDDMDEQDPENGMEQSEECNCLPISTSGIIPTTYVIENQRIVEYKKQFTQNDESYVFEYDGELLKTTFKYIGEDLKGVRDYHYDNGGEKPSHQIRYDDEDRDNGYRINYIYNENGHLSEWRSEDGKTTMRYTLDEFGNDTKGVLSHEFGSETYTFSYDPNILWFDKENPYHFPLSRANHPLTSGDVYNYNECNYVTSEASTFESIEINYECF